MGKSTALRPKEPRLNIRIDKDLKETADAICDELGLTLSTAVNVFLKQLVLKKAIPFPLDLNPRGLSETAFEAEKKANVAIKSEIEDAFANGFPVALYDVEKKCSYLKYPDGRKVYNAE